MTFENTFAASRQCFRSSHVFGNFTLLLLKRAELVLHPVKVEACANKMFSLQDGEFSPKVIEEYNFLSLFFPNFNKTNTFSYSMGIVVLTERIHLDQHRL